MSMTSMKGTILMSEIRQRVSEVLSLPGDWFPSKYTPDVFPDSANNQALHKVFAIQLGGIQLSDARRRAGDPIDCQTTMEVKFVHKLRADNLLADYDAALDAGQVLLRRILTVSQTDCQFILESFSQIEANPEQTQVTGAINFTVKFTTNI